jgi:hypothetical protein
VLNVAFVGKWRKDSWTLSHNGVDNQDPTNRYIYRGENSVKSEMPSDNAKASNTLTDDEST